MTDIEQTGCCIVGGGPAGAVLGLLLACQGVSVVLLEAHGDFNREFRGDAIHPSTLELMEQLGLLAELLQVPHTRHDTMRLNTRQGSKAYLELRGLPTPHPYILRMSQARFLEFVTMKASHYSNFRLIMSARVEELVEQAGVISGVRYRTNEGHREIRARLVVGADGRFSRVRELAHLRSKSVAQPIDILWFQLPRQSSDPPTDGGLYVGNGALTFIRNRGNVWQVACLLPKGAYQHIKRVGLEPVRDSVAEVVPWLADRTCVLSDWSQTSLLVVESSRVLQWHRPGLLVIGDAAHVMSPVGGVGINLAIQDAVAAAKLLGPKLKAGTLTRRDLALIQRRRELPTRLTQLLQDLFLQYVLSNAATSGWQSWLGRAAEHTPVVRRLRTRLFAFGGLHPERLMQGSVRFPAY